MMKKMLLATSGALALMMLLAGTVFAAGPATAAASAAAGQPAMDKDVDFGYYIWYDGNRIHLRTTDRGNGPDPSEYTGTITAHGTRNDPATITDVSLIKAEDDDSAVASGNKLDFRFRTYNGIDGVDLTAKDARDVTFALYRKGEDGQQHLISTDHIFLGAGEVNPPGNPFTLFAG